ncbi:MAG TPA: hypothetical protein IAC67_02560 [Candidatus Coproplasma excrementipullorum]|nr:hypothetical protein [Candidatus Coproplasma excrementipullorum]
MKIEVKRLIALKKYVGNFAYDCPPPEGKLILPLAKVEGSLKVEGEYEIYDDDSVGISLKISYKLKGQCSYCLEDAERDVEYSYEALFVPDKDDADNYYYDGTKLDITLAVDDAFVFSQPEVLLCKSCAKSADI